MHLLTCIAAALGRGGMAGAQGAVAGAALEGGRMQVADRVGWGLAVVAERRCDCNAHQLRLGEAP